MTRRLVLPLLLLIVALVPATAARAADSHAPAGARLDWLPAGEWVMSSWLPFDEARLDALLHTDHAELLAWLDDHRTIAQLARRHGVTGSSAALARRLVAPRAGVRPALRRLLEARAREVLTQGHLSRHVLFHVFHTPAIPAGARSVFGMSPARFRALRDAGRSPLAIAAAGGRSAAHVRGALWALLRARAARGVRLGAMSSAEAAGLLAQQREQLPPYLLRTFRTPEQQLAFLCRPH